MRIRLESVIWLEERGLGSGNVNVIGIKTGAPRERGQGIGVEEEAGMEEEDWIVGMTITGMGGNQTGTGSETGLEHEADPDLLPGMVIEDQEVQFDNTSC